MKNFFLYYKTTCVACVRAPNKDLAMATLLHQIETVPLVVTPPGMVPHEFERFVKLGWGEWRN